MFQNSFVSPVSSCLIKLHETLKTGLVSNYLLGEGGGALWASPSVSEMVQKFVGSLNRKLVILMKLSKSQLR